MESHGLTPDQFDFRSKHATIEQIHRTVKRINNDMEAGNYCAAIFLDRFVSLLTKSGIKNYFIKLTIAFRLISMAS